MSKKAETSEGPPPDNMSDKAESAIGPPPEYLNISLLQQYVASKPSTVTVTPHSIFTGGEADVIGNDGQPLLKCTSRLLSSTKDFAFTDGTPLFILERHLFSRHRAFTVNGPDGTELVAIHWRFSLGKPKLDATWMMDGREIMLEVRHHGLTGREIGITLGGAEVANVEKTGLIKQTYTARIAAGVDQALVVALIMACVQAMKEHRSNNSGG